MFNKNGGCYPQNYYRYRNDDFDELNDLFNKKFQFRFDEAWLLPDDASWFSAPPWQVKGLDILKTRLNFYKSQLNDFNIEEWSSHTRRRNPAGEVCWKLRCLVNPEFLTQAWTKFYECAYTYNIIPPEAVCDRKMVSLHLCEAPGAFITSLNHYLKLNHPDIEWKWVASTLNPYYEGNSPSNMISDDRFMFHTLNSWVFGADNTGNLMDWDNSQAIIKKAQSLGQVLLVTADGSIDCLQKPDAQEEVTSPLHYCEIVTALQALSQGGTFIFKLFTMFEHSTVSLMYMITHLFGEVNIYKPITSRQGNSEVYAICLKYKGSELLKPFLPKLQAAYGTDSYANLSLFPLDSIPEEFIKQVHDCANYFSSIQCQVINNNLQAYLMQNNALFRDVKKIRAMVAAEFIWQYSLKPLNPEDEILKGILHEENKINTNPRYHRGSYTERQSYVKMNLKEKSKSLSTFLEAEMLSNPTMAMNGEPKWVFHDDNLALTLQFTHGRPLPKVNSSKFIFVPIFKLYLQIFAEDQFREIILTKDKVQKTQKMNEKECNGQTLHFPEFNYTQPYNVYEKACFKVLLDALKDLSVNDSLVLRNYNTLTHFSVSVLFILSKKCFEKTGFTSCGDIVLNNLITKETLHYLEAIESECRKILGDESKDVLNCLPVQATNSGEFFHNIVLFNNTFYRNKCMEYLTAVQNFL